MRHYPAEFHEARTFLRTLQDAGLPPDVARAYTRLAVAKHRDDTAAGDVNAAAHALSPVRAAYIAALEAVADEIAEAEMRGASPCLH